MNVPQLLAHFDRVSEAPDAIPRLRRFVFTLAAHGDLTGSANVAADTRPLGDLAEFVMGQAPPGETCNEHGEGVLFVKVGEFGERYPEERSWTTQPLKFARRGDVLICVVGATVGKLNLAIDCAIGRSVAAVRPSRHLDSEYLYFALMPFTLSLRENARGSAQGVIGRSHLSAIPVWCPSIEEQRRVVAKVDELMALCDELEAARVAREATRDRLTAASLARLNEPDPETFQADARFTLNALPALTARTDQIKALRQTILNLAVRGKLVPQDSADEPVDTIVARLGTGGSRREHGLAHDETQTLGSLPHEWVWLTVTDIAAKEPNSITDGPFGANLKTEHYVKESGYRVVRLQNIEKRRFREEFRAFIDRERFARLAKHHVFAGDLVIAGLVDPSIRCCQLPSTIGPALVKADCYRLKVHAAINSKFIEMYLNSTVCEGFGSVHHHGMTLTRLGLGNFRSMPVPIPPRSEQDRIVAKVDELMALCDQLEAGLATIDQTRSRLLDALLAEALAPASMTRSAMH